MRDNNLFINQIDWLTVLIYALLVSFGLANIYAVNYDALDPKSLFDISTTPGRQVMFICVNLVVILAIMLIDYLFYSSFVVYIIYGITVFLLILVLFVGRKTGGAVSWIDLGFGFKLQPSEFSKVSVILLLAKFHNDKSVNYNNGLDLLKSFAIIFFPGILILLQPDAGTFIVSLALIIVLYREGLSPILPTFGIIAAIIFVLTLVFKDHLESFMVAIVALGLLFILYSIYIKKDKSIKSLLSKGVAVLMIVGLVYSFDAIFSKLPERHQNRINVLLDPSIDPRGIGYNMNQSKIAIGSGGLFGKGFLKGTQTTYGFVPEQSTDFIFCTIGEEHGWIGSFFVVTLFMVLILRLIWMAERQKSNLGRVYGYGVATILFVHFAINIGMTIGLFPVIGIPLPFFSYGGSSLVAFTIMLFIMIKLDAHRGQVLRH